MPHRPTWPSPILQYRAHAVHMILFVPSTGFQSSATLPIALPGGSRTSRTSFSEIIVLGTLLVLDQYSLGSGYRITDDRKCSRLLARRGSLPFIISTTSPRDASTLPLSMRCCA